MTSHMLTKPKYLLFEHFFGQINQTLWIREAFNTFCCCCSLPRTATNSTEEINQNECPETANNYQTERPEAANGNIQVAEVTPFLNVHFINNNCVDRENNMTGSSLVVSYRHQNGSDPVSIKRQTRPSTRGNEEKKDEESHGNLLDRLI